MCESQIIVFCLVFLATLRIDSCLVLLNTFHVCLFVFKKTKGHWGFWVA